MVWDSGLFGYVARRLAAEHNLRGIWNIRIAVHLAQMSKYTHHVTLVDTPAVRRSELGNVPWH